MYLEPVSGAVILADRAGGLGHIDLDGARVLHSRRVPKLDADGVTRGHSGRLGLAGEGERAFVAAEIGREGRDGVRLEELGRHVDDLPGVLSNVLKAASDLAVDDELVEDVVSRGDGAKAQEGRGDRAELHGGSWCRARTTSS